MSSASILRVQGLTAGYDGVAVVHDVDLTVGPGEVVALLGANGAGKTTTLLAVSGLVPKLGGSIEVAGEATHDRRRVRVADVWQLARRGVAHVPEDRGLFFDLTTAENLRLGRPARGDAVPIDQILTWFPALEKVLTRRAGRLSGGEQQMLALARAVIGKPRLLLVDEMSLGLAPIIVEQLLPVLRSIATETGAGIVLVEQHVGLVLEVADRAYLLNQGRVVFDGTAAELRDRPELVESGYLGEA
ncbi:ABC transporter ATP-binding protein [Aquihabitans daechungensis]|uniref:ABC transporter ATP-binding protein n=1 Tax=Aquihabitans daechungensis TaxID=1052257 RepID=UPI003B9F5BA9